MVNAVFQTSILGLQWSTQTPIQFITGTLCQGTTLTTHLLSTPSWCAQVQLSTVNGQILLTYEVCLEVNADKPKHMVMSQDQNAGQNIKINNSSFERVNSSNILENFNESKLNSG